MARSRCKTTPKRKRKPMIETEQSPPATISVRLTIEPQTMVLRDPQPPSDPTAKYQPFAWEQQPTISVTVTSQAERPLTMFIYYSIFHLGLNETTNYFTCWDLTSDCAVALSLHPRLQRGPFSRTFGDYDEEYYCTLYPGVPLTVTSTFTMAYSTAGGLQRGHKYRFSIREGLEIEDWWYGTKEEVLAPPGKVTDVGDQEPSGPALCTRAEPVDFEVT